MSTALYRRYRPETFADVIGQEHVTAPLMAAIDKDRINHAYLFSGPRGCGKTTSARILARCLNCAQGPTSTPCGVCDSCVELARNGSGSLDVIEIDAASHGGVDDARDLRERATFAPVRDRFKIFIIDEAHMVTSAGFNALLKIVEEPPEHILFIFATTEPDKVIGTIRSRTHHYPFRLVPPEPLLVYLEQLCHQENVPVAPGVLSLVIRAGGGSVRDSLSVLDQLMAGAGEGGLDYELAVSLLGYTHATLLDDVVDSMAADDAGTVFNAVDRVIQTGHDPRRFVEDLLERFRDLIVINAVPEGATSILRGVPEDQLNRMRTQANQLGAGELSRAADVTNTALTEMTGATSPRLHLELLCARLLLPAADASVRGTLARVDRIERRLEYAGGAPAEATAEPVEAPKAPARSRLDVPRNAEEAAARWALPQADPASAPDASESSTAGTPASNRPASTAPTADSSPDWGASWGVSTDSGFAEPAAPARPASPPQPTEGSGPAIPAAQTAAGPGPAIPAARPAEGSGPAIPAARPAEGSEPAIPAAQQPQSADAGSDDDGSASAAPSAVPQDGEPARRPASDPAHRPADGSEGRSSAPTSGADTAGAARQSSPDAPAQEERRFAPEARTDEQGQGAPGGQQNQQAEAPTGYRQDNLPPEPARQPDQQGSQQSNQAHPPQELRGGEPQRQSAPSGGNIEMVRRAWPEIMDEVAKIKRATWLIVNVSAKPRSFEGNQLVLAFVNQGNAIGFQRGPHMDNLKQAIHTVLGLTCSIEAIHDAGGSGESGPKVLASSSARDSTPGHSPSVPSAPPADQGTRNPEPPVWRPTAQPQATPGPSSSAPPHSATPTGQSAHPGQPERGGQGAPQAQAQAPGPATPRTSATPRASGPQGTHPEAPRTPAPTSAGPTSSAGRKSPGAGGAVAETVSGWDPSMSDDSWALVEPPEEAFDPGPGWESVPQDPAERRPMDGGPGARHGSTRAAAYPEAQQNRNLREQPRAQRTADAPQRHGTATSAAGGQPPVPAAAGQPAARPSRSVVWSPDAAEGATTAADPTEQNAPAQPSGPGAGQDASPRAGSHAAVRPDQDEQAVPAGPRGIPHFIDSTTDSATPGPSLQEGPPQGQGAPATGAPPEVPNHARPSARPAATGTAGARPAGSGAAATTDAPPSDQPAAAAPELLAEDGRRKPVSRYQQLLDEAERARAEEAAAARGVVDLRFVEDEPSADDETLEDSGLVGRTAIERILNGRLIEERGINGQ